VLSVTIISLVTEIFVVSLEKALGATLLTLDALFRLLLLGLVRDVLCNQIRIGVGFIPRR